MQLKKIWIIPSEKERHLVSKVGTLLVQIQLLFTVKGSMGSLLYLNWTIISSGLKGVVNFKKRNNVDTS